MKRAYRLHPGFYDHARVAVAVAALDDALLEALAQASRAQTLTQLARAMRVRQPLARSAVDRALRARRIVAVTDPRRGPVFISA